MDKKSDGDGIFIAVIIGIALLGFFSESIGNDPAAIFAIIQPLF